MAAISEMRALCFLSALFALYCGLSAASRLMIPKVLIPHSHSPSVNFTLEVSDGGCFHWSVSRVGVVRLHVEGETERGCSSRAVVVAVAKQPLPQSALVALRSEGGIELVLDLAEQMLFMRNSSDLQTGEIIHCDVFVSMIHELEIVTTTRELILDDTPISVSIRAKNKEGDTFSTVSGLVFEWKLITDTESQDVMDAHDVIRMVKFHDSMYEAPQVVYDLERQGLMGHVALVEGIRTGTAKVQAVLKDSAYSSLISADVTLTVIANVMLFPSQEVHVAVGSYWHYDVRLMQQGRFQNIQMPSDQFYLEVGDPHVVRLDVDSSNVEALSEGYTIISLHDKYVRRRQISRQPSVGIHVTPPHRVEFSIFPQDNWFLGLGIEYEIVVKLFNRENVELYIADNIRMVCEFPRFLHVLYSSVNGTYHIVKPKEIGTSEIVARLEGFISTDGRLHKAKLYVEVSQEIEVLEPIRVIPDRVILPWHSATQPSYRVQLEAEGGSRFPRQWFSSNTSVAAVSQKGELVTIGPGSSTIVAASVRNLHVRGLCQVHVLSPHALKLLEGVTEVELGATLYLPLALFAHFPNSNVHVSSGSSELVPFTDCSHMQFKVDVEDMQKLLYVPDGNRNRTSPTPGCVTLVMKAASVGFTRVSISLILKKGDISASVVISIYKPLRAFSPSELVVLPLGSSKDVAFEGGPRPLIDRPHAHFKTLTLQSDTAVEVHPVDDGSLRNSDLHVFRVLCLNLGETDIILSIGNEKSQGNILPVVLTARMRIICAVPSSMVLKPIVSRPPAAKTQCMLEAGKVVSQSYKDLQISVIVMDDKGRTFDNVSSLAFEWQLSDTFLVEFDGLEQTLSVEEDISTGVVIVTKNYKTLRPKNREGILKVHCSLKNYRREILQFYAVPLQHHFETIYQVLTIELVEDASFTLQELSLFNHPQNEASVEIQKGSGIFDFAPHDTGIAEVRYLEKTHMFQIMPKQDGFFTLSAVDQCLTSRQIPVLRVQVFGIKEVRIQMVDKVEIGKEIIAEAWVLDDEGRPLSGAVLPLLEVLPMPASGIIDVIPVTKLESSGHSELSFVVKGETLGQTTISFWVKRKGTEQLSAVDIVKSARHSIQVFSPLRLQPRNISLVIGSTFQVSSVGGPHPRSTIEFFLDNTDVAAVSGLGVIEALQLGQTKLFARAVGVDGERKIIHSQDEIRVHVFPLTGVRIVSPLTRIQVGVTMPMYAVGLDENHSPFAFGAAQPALIFTWSVNNKEIARLQSAFNSINISFPTESQFAMELTVKQPGHVMVELKVSARRATSESQSQILHDAVLSDKVQLQAFSGLQLTSPQLSIDELRIAPNTEFLLRTNTDQASPISYGVSELSRHTGGRNGNDTCLRVDPSGTLKSGSLSCSATVILSTCDDSGITHNLALLVAVKPPTFLMATPVSLFRTTNTLDIVPIGAQLMFHVSVHDNTGREFHAMVSNLNFRPSRFDLFEIYSGSANNTLMIKTNNAGLTTLRIWDASFPSLETFVFIRIGEVIRPTRPIVVLGSRLCFYSPLLGIDGTNGRWSSDNDGVVQISETRGLAVAKSVGTATVMHHVSVDVVTSTEVNVVSIASASFATNALKLPFVANVPVKKIWHIPVMLMGSLETTQSGLGLDANCSDPDLYHGSFIPFDCNIKFTNAQIEIDITDVFQAKAAFNFKKGVFECIIISNPTDASVIRQLSSAVSDVEIQVVVPERAKQTSLVSLPFRTSFVPGFFVHASELHLSDVNPLGTIVVSAIDLVFNHLQVSSSDSSMVEVLAIEMDPKFPSTRICPVKLGPRFWQLPGQFSTNATELKLFCSLTKYQVVVAVHVEILGDLTGKCPVDYSNRTGWSGLIEALAESYQKWIITLLSIFGTAIAVFIGYHALMGQRYFAATPQTGVYLDRTSVNGRPMWTGTPSSEQPHLWSLNDSGQSKPTYTPRRSPRF